MGRPMAELPDEFPCTVTNWEYIYGLCRDVADEVRAAPYEPDVVVATDSVFEQKADAIWKLESQIESAWATGGFEEIVPVPDDPEGREQRRRQVRDRIATRDSRVANKYRDALVEIHGSERGEQVKYAEAFELCEYGRRPSKEELQRLFPIAVKK